ncbi:MAG: discoidin domain-containing protein [Lachnospiraceae bacterium]|jgi:hypothetical protein|nr:discoidin domain-containing protein [Lachnospiraceae bacterium]MCH4027358.1 discoidin domain-containing protein [Lachnospiraceae bacterium]MCH4065198.1 discoidin domain-containing protein [Lachnospiraceae bacterium]MCH4111238.1 discoidin domain-containing protein [Lachnospiraceae bacterium]
MEPYYDLIRTPGSNSGTAANGISYTLSAKNHYSSLDAYMGFGTNTNYESNGTDATWIQIQFGSPVVVNSFAFVEKIGTDSFGSFEFQVSDDGSNWSTLYTYEMKLLETSQTIELGNTTAYAYYRFFNTTSTGNGSSWRRIKGIYLYGCLPEEMGDNYKVVFHSNDGKGNATKQVIVVDSTVKLSKCSFVRTGYDFLGWAVSSDGTVIYSDEEEIKNLGAKDETVDLYAVWRRTIQVIAHWIKVEGRWVKI